MGKKRTFEFVVPPNAAQMIIEAYGLQSQMSMDKWLAQIVVAVSKQVLTEQVAQRAQQAAQEIQAFTSDGDRGGSDLPDLPPDTE